MIVSSLPYPASGGGGPSYGPELVSNGTFDTGYSPWTGHTATLSVATGVLKVSANSNLGSPCANYTLTLTPGSTYQVGYDSAAGTGTPLVGIGTARGGTPIGTTPPGAGGVGTGQTFQFVASVSTMYINLFIQNPASGLYALFDNISVKEVL